MFQNVFLDPKILKEKQTCLIFSMSFEIFVSFQKAFLNFFMFPISYTCLHVISYKCKYVLFHLNMFRLFQKVYIYIFEIKLDSNKNFSRKCLIQRFNPHSLS
jgi:hypothetical protein